MKDEEAHVVSKTEAAPGTKVTTHAYPKLHTTTTRPMLNEVVQDWRIWRPILIPRTMLARSPEGNCTSGLL